MKTIAIVSDIHSNLDALEPVVRDIASQKVDEIWNLGDTVGYCDKPRQCLEWAVNNCKVNLQGNHEACVVAVAEAPKLDLRSAGMGGEGAPEGLYWTIRQLFGVDRPLGSLRDAKEYNMSLLASVLSPEKARILEKEFLDVLALEIPKAASPLESRRDYATRVADSVLYGPEGEKIRSKLAGKPKHIKEGKAMLDRIAAWPASKTIQLPDDRFSVPDSYKVLLVHDNPIKPGDRGYVLYPDNPYYDTPSKKYSPGQIFEVWDDRWPDTKMIFYGHSHFSGVDHHKKGEVLPSGRVLARDRVLVGVGSVGIPRDGSKEATYAIVKTDGQRWGINIRRVGGIGWDAVGRRMKSVGLKEKFEDCEGLD